MGTLCVSSLVLNLITWSAQYWDFLGTTVLVAVFPPSLSREGVGTKKKQAEIITEAEEELLWVKGVLGDETPQRLLDTTMGCVLPYAVVRRRGGGTTR